MPRIIGVNIPAKKQIEIALTYIYGIGNSLSRKILTEAQIDPQKRASQLTSHEISRLKEIIETNYKLEVELRRDLLLNIKRLKDISCCRGIRYIKVLPVRGSGNKTNTRTVRGNVRKTVGSGKRSSLESK